MDFESVLFGSDKPKRPQAPQINYLDQANKAMDSQFGMKSQGERVGGQALNMMRAGLGGYRSNESAAMLGKAQQQAQAARAQADAHTRRQMARAGVSGGFAATAAERGGQAAAQQAAQSARDLTIANIAEKQNRLSQYAQQAKSVENSEMARRALATQIATGQATADTNRYLADAQMYGADMQNQSPGLFGGAVNALANYYTLGMAGDVYGGLRG